jgi:hypothetical protein
MKDKPMTPEFLYHGTSERLLPSILANGLRPRGKGSKGNWKGTVESNPGCVYLTDAYPLFFATNCARKGERLAVIQLATDRLDNGRLVPDEDVLEQAGRGHDGIPGDMRKRTRHYRARLSDFLFTENWQTSLRAMGTCGYMGTIAPSAITRVALLDPREAGTLWLTASDAQICLANYRFCQTKYRNLTNRLFGLPTEPDELDGTTAALAQMAEQPDLPESLRGLAASHAAYRERLTEELATVETLDVRP